MMDPASPPSHLASRSLFEIVDDVKHIYRFPDNGLRGVGGFGRVVHAHRPDGSECALKVVGKQHGARAELVKETIRREVQTLKGVFHPNIIRLTAAYDTPNAYYLEFDLCSEDIFMYMKLSTRTPITFNEKSAALVLRQITEALAFLHRRQIAHLDVKLENILINSPEDVRLADFGFARVLSNDIPTLITNGSGLYTAPEVLTAQLRQEGATQGIQDSPAPNVSSATAIDMWCVGIVAYLLLSGRPPYRMRVSNRAEREDMLRKIDAELDFPPQRWAGIGDVSKDFIRKLLVKDPAHRFTATEALDHLFLRCA